jgi:hypothetical protein
VVACEGSNPGYLVTPVPPAHPFPHPTTRRRHGELGPKTEDPGCLTRQEKEWGQREGIILVTDLKTSLRCRDDAGWHCRPTTARASYNLGTLASMQKHGPLDDKNRSKHVGAGATLQKFDLLFAFTPSWSTKIRQVRKDHAPASSTIRSFHRKIWDT